MKILVTGASGFIGGYVVSQLVKNRDFFIIATGRSKISRIESNINYQYIRADLTRDFPEIGCDVCIHCAGLADDQSSGEELEKNNLSATKTLIKSVKGCKTFIFISSSSVYNFKDEMIKQEDDAILDEAGSLYGISKLKSEQEIIAAELPSVYILRPRAVYGKEDRILMPRILKLIKKKFIIAPGRLHVKSSLTHVENLFEAIHKAIQQSSQGIHIYNISDDYIYCLKDIFSALSKHRYGHSNFIYIPMGILKLLSKISSHFKIKTNITVQALNYLSKDSVLSIDKAKKELGYTGKINFYEKIEELNL